MKKNEGFISGATPIFWKNQPMSFSGRPLMRADFESRVLSVEDLEKKGESITITLNFEKENAFSGSKYPKEIKLAGAIEDLRKEVLRQILKEEMGPGSEEYVVNNAIIEIEGKKVPFEEFVNQK